MARGRPPGGGSAGPPSKGKPAPRRGLSAGVQPNRRLETKNEAFVRLVNSRMPMVDETIANLRKLSNRETYEYTASQADAIVGHVQALADSVEEAFRTGGKVSTFKLEVDTSRC
jgi:hypothetical protein